MKQIALLLIIATASGCSQKHDENIDVKIGQMIMTGFRGLTVNDKSAVVHDIRVNHIGGVILFDYDVAIGSPVRNIESPSQLGLLTAKLRAAAKIPLLIAVDQEGGNVCRLKESLGFPKTVSAQYLGEKNDLKLTEKHAEKIAETLALAGINLNMAPVVDLNINTANPVIGRLERSFSADPNIVTAHAIEFIKAHHSKNVLCAVKHFPGHGSSEQDSHQGFVNVTDSWSDRELIPYRNIIKSGYADVLMTAHVYNSSIDGQFPATLSHSTITGLLREKLNYDGVVISDDIQMAAIAEHYGFETAVELAIKAGVDIILIANNLVYDENAAAKAVAVIKKMVRDGKISEQRINLSYLRIQKLKNKLLSQKLPAKPAINARKL